jgi:hypothetical protein
VRGARAGRACRGYASAIIDNAQADGTGPFRQGAVSGTSSADFDQNWTAVDPAAGLALVAALRSFTDKNRTYTAMAEAFLEDVRKEFAEFLAARVAAAAGRGLR